MNKLNLSFQRIQVLYYQKGGVNVKKPPCIKRR